MEVVKQQDGAADGGPEAVGAVLGVFRAIGPTGLRLALQMGDEEVSVKAVGGEGRGGICSLGVSPRQGPGERGL